MQIDRILGNVGVLYVGVYNPSTQYEYLNCVTYNGSSYVCVNQDGVTGVTPGTTNDWQLSAQKGDTGAQGTQGEQGIQGATGNGIQSIEKTSSSGLTDTYTIAFTDGSSTTFKVENGKGIVSIEKTSSDANVDTYTITYNDDTTSTFTVTNGEVTNEELQQALAQERVFSDGKYARALKTPVTDIESTQIYAENDVVDDLVIKGVELTQVVTENSPSLDNPSEVKVASEQNITINETNITIPLTNSSIGQYADTIDRESNVQNKVIQELTLTGDENFNMQIEPNYLKTPDESIDYYINFYSVLINSELLCNTFKNKFFDSKYRAYENVEGISSGGGYKRLYIRIKKERLETVDVNGIKKFLKELYDAGKPVKVYYIAANPTKNSLQEEIQTALSDFKLYQDLNNIAIDGGSISFVYNKSLSKTIEEMQDEIQSKDTLIQNLTTRVEALEKAQIDNVTEDLGGN